MLRTLLVDDDFLVRSYLKTLECWKKAGYEILFDVRDGEEALHVLEEEKIDVIFTDISMPLMDGIELIQKVREMEKQVYIIVLSCHDDFDHVKEAMRLGADEYVLKNTLDEESLFELLEKTRKQIEGRQQKTRQQEHTKRLIQMGSHTLKYHFFNGILAGTLSGADREEKRREARIEGKFQNSAVITMFEQGWNSQSQQLTQLEAEQYSSLFRHGLAAELEGFLEEDSACAEIIYLGAGIYCCFLDMSFMRRSSVMMQRLTNMASVCYKFCEKQPYPFGISVSNICIGEDGIRQAYQQAREMMKLAFYEGSSILYYECGKELSQHMPPAGEDFCRKIEILKNGRRREEIDREMVAVLKACETERTDGKVVLQWLKKLDKRAGVNHPAEFYQELRTMEQLKKLARQYSHELFKQKQREIPSAVSGSVRRSLEFIHNNFQNQISLQDAADAAGVNPAYLSYLFKQEMKIGFSNYLQECRLACAKDLLLTTTYKVKEVAEQSGFNDYHYFSKTFKKFTGFSPAEYRNESEE